MIRRNIKKRLSKKADSFNSSIKDETSIVNNLEEKTEQYTKTDINRMSTAELKELAAKEKIDGSEDMTGGELKKILIDYFNL